MIPPKLIITFLLVVGCMACFVAGIIMNNLFAAAGWLVSGIGLAFYFRRIFK